MAAKKSRRTHKSAQPQYQEHGPTSVPDPLPPNYYPTKAQLEEDLTIDATPEELLEAVFGRNPRRATPVKPQ